MYEVRRYHFFKYKGRVCSPRDFIFMGVEEEQRCLINLSPIS